MTKVECLLTVQEFADRGRFGVSTIYEWIRDGRLVEGIHYVKRGRCLRFPFPACLTEPLAEAHTAASSNDASPPQGQRRAIGSGANLDYGL